MKKVYQDKGKEENPLERVLEPLPNGRCLRPVFVEMDNEYSHLIYEDENNQLIFSSLLASKLKEISTETGGSLSTSLLTLSQFWEGYSNKGDESHYQGLVEKCLEAVKETISLSSYKIERIRVFPEGVFILYR